jgi:hypothetical protein
MWKSHSNNTLDLTSQKDQNIMSQNHIINYTIVTTKRQVILENGLLP